jgi:hypothetical protein
MGFNQRLYNTWYEMVRRCNNPHRVGFKNYGGRGIQVCEEWQKYHNFRDWAENNGYDSSLQIDRADNEGDYEPSNCRFVTREENAQNRRDTILVEGKKLPEIAKEYGVNYRSLLMKHIRIREQEKITLARLLTNENTEKKIKVAGLTFEEISKKYGAGTKKLQTRYFNLKARNDNEISLELLLTSEKEGLHIVEGKTFKEIAAEYNINYNTFRSRAFVLLKRGVPLTIDVILNSSNVYSASQSITTPEPKGQEGLETR